MEMPAVRGLLYLYEQGDAKKKDLHREISRHCYISGQATALVRELIAKGYVLISGNETCTINPVFDQMKSDFGISLSGTLGDRPGLYTNPIFHGRRLERDPKLCFVLMPFRDPFTSIYSDHVEKVVTGCGLICQKANSLFGPRPIIEDIWRCIFASTVIIADLTGRNANVFYEVGVAHTLGRDVILITQSTEDIPFDLKHIRCINYEYTPPGAARFEGELKQTLGELLAQRTHDHK